MPPTRSRRPAALACAVLALTLPLTGITAAYAEAAGRHIGAVATEERTFAAQGRTPATAESTTARRLRVRATRSGLELPPPSGPYAVGRDTLHLVDGSRSDPWVPEDAARELMVSMYYPAYHPAPNGTGRQRAPYMTRPEAKALLEGQKLADKVPAGTLTSVRTNTHRGARPAPGRHPLVVLSPGFTLQRGTLSVLAEELAGRGYVVAVLDHAHESYGTSFPGGRFTTCAACKAVEQAPDEAESGKVMAKVARGRSADISFVLDRLTGPRPAWRLGRLIDERRIGAAGHSIGGNAAAQAMADDPRVRAGVNMDGTFFAPVPRRGLHGRPFLLLGTAAGHSPGGTDESWDRDWARLDGWKRWLTVSGAGHFTFIDLPVLGAQLGMDDPDAPLPGDRSGQITRDYVGAFFDRQLRGIPQPLLNGPSPANPEVGFEHP